jgi:hypothetical protein
MRRRRATIEVKAGALRHVVVVVAVLAGGAVLFGGGTAQNGRMADHGQKPAGKMQNGLIIAPGAKRNQQPDWHESDVTASEPAAAASARDGLIEGPPPSVGVPPEFTQSPPPLTQQDIARILAESRARAAYSTASQ